MDSDGNSGLLTDAEKEIAAIDKIARRLKLEDAELKAKIRVNRVEVERLSKVQFHNRNAFPENISITTTYFCTQIIHGFDEYRPVEKGVIICTGCIDRDFYVVEIQALEDTQSAIYVDTLMDTENPALALQALNTNMMRMLHAEYLPQFDYNDRQTAVFYETTILPIKTRGFIIVITLIWLRLIATFWITVAFLTKTRYSRLNNAWQVLSHLRTLKMDDFLDESLTDKEIKERLQAQGTAHQLVRLEPNGDVGDIGLWRRSEKKAARDTKEEEPIESEQGEAA
ncbi:uncharacterized protein K452DRAFT_298007 [Aplosporella prunicola CBS 121167]|uniref:Uncharacterized protein n=1 Tax=Aplosporella prunicola CBS 121167 TaxID=1176127 RepID=A0A6A6BHF8_9PEZI|nr:uncharacterized protein K452DRAFT_298007 [Aplosporella prunicola CBS 121167]KAF2141981.1 hypothetical protein K452DRAFT_298007 [Aplosporella prunicola CBS 121167]